MYLSNLCHEHGLGIRLWDHESDSISTLCDPLSHRHMCKFYEGPLRSTTVLTLDDRSTTCHKEGTKTYDLADTLLYNGYRVKK